MCQVTICKAALGMTRSAFVVTTSAPGVTVSACGATMSASEVIISATAVTKSAFAVTRSAPSRREVSAFGMTSSPAVCLSKLSVIIWIFSEFHETQFP